VLSSNTREQVEGRFGFLKRKKHLLRKEQSYTIASNNASVEKISNAKSSLARFENKKYFHLHTLKNALAFYNSGVVIVN
jgi:hypothetical protein